MFEHRIFADKTCFVIINFFKILLFLLGRIRKGSFLFVLYRLFVVLSIQKRF